MGKKKRSRSRASAAATVIEAAPEAVGAHEESGAYAIDRRQLVHAMLPPSSPEAETFSLDSIAELDDATVSLIPEPPPVALHSGVFRTNPSAPPPRWESSERAQIDIVDLTLSLDNPYLASSLVPPPQRPFPWLRAFGITTGILAAAAVTGYFAFSSARSLHAPTASAKAAAVAPRVAEPAAAAVATHAVPVLEQAPVVAEAAPADPLPAAVQVAAEPVIVAEPAPVAAVAVPVVATSRVLPEAPVSSSPVVRVKPRAEPAMAPTVEPAQVAAAVPAASVTTENAATPIVGETAPVAAEPTVATDLPTPVAEAAAVEAPAEPLPDTLSREQVGAGFESLRSALVECAAGSHGITTIQTTITSSGRVSSALIQGAFQGTPAGSCMARAVRGTRFPAFAGEAFVVRYPLSL